MVSFQHKDGREGARHGCGQVEQRIVFVAVYLAIDAEGFDLSRTVHCTAAFQGLDAQLHQMAGCRRLPVFVHSRSH